MTLSTEVYKRKVERRGDGEESECSLICPQVQDSEQTDVLLEKGGPVEREIVLSVIRYKVA